MKHLLILVCTSLLLFSASSQKIQVKVIGQPSEQLQGRLLLIFSERAQPEPRFTISDGPETQIVFGADISNWNSSNVLTISNSDFFGYPIEQMNQLPKRRYYVQVVFHKYEIFRRKDGHTVQLPMDRGEGQHWNLAPGNLYSTAIEVNWQGPNSTLQLDLDKIIPPIEEPKDTKYIKHIKIQSKLLTEFWGRPMFLGAHILLPEGFDENPTVKYPLAIFHGHFPSDFDGFRTTPPDENLRPDTSKRFNLIGYNKIVQEEAYRFYKLWTGPNFPRVIAIEIQHANPYYDDSYAVNSANLGPYGDAITYELIPEIERIFRGIGEGWARFMYGGSTGGWEALAAQVFYPKEYNGAYAACPDPIDFRHYMTINLYEDKNAYYLESPFKKTLRPGHRNYLGHVSATVKDMNLKELALGNKSRSGDQFDIWEAVFSPVAKDGYPARIWDKKTGIINKDIVSYWKENYDLTHIIQRDWNKIGKDLEGKIHIYVGDMDNFYLNNAVYTAEDMLKKLQNPPCNCVVDYGDRAEHCWNGSHELPNYISRLRYHEMFILKWVKDLDKRVPSTADLKSWKY